MLKLPQYLHTVLLFLYAARCISIFIGWIMVKSSQLLVACTLAPLFRWKTAFEYYLKQVGGYLSKIIIWSNRTLSILTIPFCIMIGCCARYNELVDRCEVFVAIAIRRGRFFTGDGTFTFVFIIFITGTSSVPNSMSKITSMFLIGMELSILYSLLELVLVLIRCHCWWQ